MIVSMLIQFLIVALAGLLLWAAVSDARHLIIPNRIGAAIAVAWLAYAALRLIAGAPGSVILLALAMAAGAFVMGVLLFMMRLIGGGDVKLFAAVTLWAGPTLIMPFTMTTLILGGVLALTYLSVRTVRNMTAATLPGMAPPSVGIALMGALKSQVPFGLAIAGGGLFVAYRLLFGAVAY